MIIHNQTSHNTMLSGKPALCYVILNFLWSRSPSSVFEWSSFFAPVGFVVLWVHLISSEKVFVDAGINI